MKTIAIPADISFQIEGKPISLGFVKDFIPTILNSTGRDGQSVFGNRKGAERANTIERVMEKASGGTASIEDADHKMILDALVLLDNGNGWNPIYARKMQAAGWFSIIEKAGDA